jgi:hypothetical protein
MIFLSFVYLLLSQTFAQTPSKPITLGVNSGVSGGSFYDIPRGMSGFDKYGKERLSPTGHHFIATLESDDFGNIYFRRINVNRLEDGTHLGRQTNFKYESPLRTLKDGKYLDLVVRGDISHYSQKDHLIFFRTSPEHNADIEKNLQFEPHIRTNQIQTYAIPSISICYNNQVSAGNFDFEGFASVMLAPIGFMAHNTAVTDNQAEGLDPAPYEASGLSYAVGAEAKIEGVAKYKDRYYLKVRVDQSFLRALNSGMHTADNRVSHVELGHNVNKNLSFNVYYHHNELLLMNQNRHAIDVYNNIGVGLKYKIPYRR